MQQEPDLCGIDSMSQVVLGAAVMEVLLGRRIGNRAMVTSSLRVTPTLGLVRLSEELLEVDVCYRFLWTANQGGWSGRYMALNIRQS